MSPNQAGPATRTTSHRWWALGLIAAAQFMVIMDTSIIGVALPEMQADLGFAPQDLSWVFNAYVVAFGGLLLLGGRLSDLYGAKRVFKTGWAVLAAGSLAAVPVVHDHGGHVDKFIGDGLLAVFGAPQRLPNHAAAAVSAAQSIAAAVEAEFHGELSVGIGINTGTVVAGNVGGAGRFEFSVIGDPVNVAARVESATRQTGDTILISGRTLDVLDDDAVRVVERPDVVLKGKSGSVSLFAIQSE